MSGSSSFQQLRRWLQSRSAGQNRRQDQRALNELQRSIERTLSAWVSAAPPGRRAREALRLWEPRLRWILDQQNLRLASLDPAGPEAARQRVEISGAEARLQKLRRAAEMESLREQQQQQGEGENRDEARHQAAGQQADARAAGAPRGERAAARARLRIPLLRRRQARLRQQAAALSPAGRDYWETVRRFWQAEEEAQRLAAAAAEERDRQVHALTRRAMSLTAAAERDLRRRESAPPSTPKKPEPEPEPEKEDSRQRAARLVDGGTLLLPGVEDAPEGPAPAGGRSRSRAAAPLIRIDSLIGELHLQGDPRALLEQMLRDPAARRRLHDEIDLRLDQLVRRLPSPGSRG